MLKRILKTQILLLVALFITSCATNKDRIIAASKIVGEVEASKTIAEYPVDCRLKSRSGVRVGERLDVALLRTDQALTRQNNRTQRCAEWYDELKTNIEETGQDAAN